MSAILLAILQIIISSGILYGYYHLFLRNKQFHQYNRFYLLGAMIISIAIPFLQIPVYFTEVSSESSVVMQTLQQISMSGFEDGDLGAPVPDASAVVFDWSKLLYAMYVSISVILLFRIMLSIRRIQVLKKRNTVEKLDGVHFVNTNEPGTPFSFFRWLFWDKKIELSSPAGEQIFRHEVFHIQQKHSWDVLFMELLTTIGWINPFFHLAKKEVRAIHEFLADQFAANDNGKWEYAELLLMQALQTRQTLANPFFNNQIKRRIAMITNPQKTSHRYLRKMLVLPVAAVVLTLFAFRYKQMNTPPISITIENPMTIVLDAGHGGIDPGARSPDNKYNEASLSLDLARKVQELAGEYNINVVMTRETDVLPGGAVTKDDGLRNRVSIANDIRPDAFISLHLNVSNGSSFQEKLSGFEAYITARRQDIKDDRLTSSILQELSPVYKTNLTIQRRKGSGVYVLDQNKYPSVILECGYINNQKDLSFITDKANQEKIARGILRALRNYHSGSGVVIEERKTSILDTVPRVTGVEDKKVKVIEVPIAVDSTLKGVIIRGDIKKEPLFVVDGVVRVGTVKSIFDTIKPERIQAINVLKDQPAIDKYGQKAINGVVEIITKPEVIEVREIQLTDVVVEGRSTIKEQKEVVVVGYGTELKEDQEPIFEKVEIEPSFIGGDGSWNKYLERNLNGNIAVENNAPRGSYTVRIKFVVDKEGIISRVKPLSHLGYGMEEEVIRVLKKGPKWSPAIQNGKKVSAWRIQPVTFVVERTKSIT